MASNEQVPALPSGVSPRGYQVELFLEAQKRNVIAFLDTGTGKTMVSVLLIKDKAYKLYEDGEKKRVTVFLAPKVDLVIQQAEAIANHTEFAVQHFVGSMQVDFWSREQWREKITQCEVMAMTPQILLNILTHGFIAMREINLLIFDEAHHVMKQDPSNMVMSQHYFNADAKERPHIFGMTASPLASKITNPIKLSEFLNKLEGNLNAKVITVKDRAELESVTPSPAEMIIRFPPLQVSQLEETLAILDSVAVNLRVKGADVTQQVHERNLRLAGFAFEDANEYERDKHTSESTAMARDICTIAYTLQELGPWPAAAGAAMLLMPKKKSMYSLMHRFKNKERMNAQEQKRLEALLGRLVPSQNDDCAWDDTDLSEYLGTVSHDTVGDEHKVLIDEVGRAVEALTSLVGKACGQPLTFDRPCHVGDKMWLEVRRELAVRMEQALKQVPARAIRCLP
eukprot:jgi/Botrbrau1/14206/Bobra.0291s0011.1